MAKHHSLAFGFDNLTGSKRVIEINSKLGHCIDYNLVCDHSVTPPPPPNTNYKFGFIGGGGLSWGE